MNIVEHNDNIVIKEKNNVQQYLTRIIQRYFDNEYIETENSIEAIIVEALVRMKRDILHERSFVFSINNKTGHIKLNISDFNGESAFNKKTAFNKEFCSNNETIADTICMGNDDRLNDSRIPLSHNHQQYNNFVNNKEFEYENFTGEIIKIPLNETLGNVLKHIEKSSKISIHSHNNLDSVIKRLVYSGEKTEIDLRYIEILNQTLIERLDDINNIKDILEKRSQQEMKGFIDAKEKSNEYCKYAKSLAKVPPTWYDNSIKYIDEKIVGIKSFCNNLIDKAVTQEEFSNFKNSLNQYIRIVAQEDDISIDDGIVETFNDTFVRKTLIPITIPSGLGSIQKIDVCFKYDLSFHTLNEEGVLTNVTRTISIPVPYIFKEFDGTYINIRSIWNNKEGRIEIVTRSKCLLPMENIYNNKSVIHVSSDAKPYYDHAEYAHNKNSILCIIDSQDKLDYIKNIINNQKYFINGFGTFYVNEDSGQRESQWQYNLLRTSSPMTFFNWAEGEPDSFTDYFANLYIQNDGMVKTISYVDTMPMYAIYEFIIPSIDQYYRNPRISYKVYAGGE